MLNLVRVMLVCSLCSLLRWLGGSISAKSVDASGTTSGTATGKDSYVAAGCCENKIPENSRGYEEVTVVQPVAWLIHASLPPGREKSHNGRNGAWLGTRKAIRYNPSGNTKARPNGWYLGQVSKQTGVHIPPCIDVEGVTMLSRLVLPQSGLGGYQTPLSQGRRGTADTSLCFHGTYHCIPLSHRQRNVGENIIAKQACPNIEARQPRWRDALDKRRAARSPQRGARAASNLLEKLFLYRAHLVRCLGTQGEVQFNMEVNWKSSTRPASLRVKSTCKTLSLCRYKPFSSKRA
uniref:Secreted protein n=1 Tax=Pyricularia oryzae (strain P131) TaxID=1143193 RepID=L7JIG5_PYRO1